MLVISTFCVFRQLRVKYYITTKFIFECYFPFKLKINSYLNVTFHLNSKSTLFYVTFHLNSKSTLFLCYFPFKLKINSFLNVISIKLKINSFFNVTFH
jgi:hypothetical protein